MRLIDADALKQLLREYCVDDDEVVAKWYDIMGVDEVVDRAPTIDAVPVVRCKDCEWYVRSIIKQDGTLDKRYKPDWCDLYRKVREETYFCADGERIDDYKSCDTCKHHDKWWDDAICDGCTTADSRWERRDDE